MPVDYLTHRHTSQNLFTSSNDEAAPYAIDAHESMEKPRQGDLTRYLTTLSHDFGAFARALGAVSSPVTRRIWFLMTVS